MKRVGVLSLLFSITLVSVLAELPLLETALESKGGSSVPICSSVAFSFVVAPRNTTRFMFALEMVPTTQATWTMQLTRDNPETSFGLSDACALDSVTMTAGSGQSLVIVKSCGLLEGKWYVLVKTDSVTTGKFGFKPVAYRDLPTIPNLPISANSQERVSAIGNKNTFPPFDDILQRYDFFLLTIPAPKEIPKGSPMIVDLVSATDAPVPIATLSFIGTELGFPTCGGRRTNTGFFQLTPCEVQQSETWLVVVERTSAGQAYELKRYWQKAIILDTTLGMKEMHTIASAKKSIFFSFASSWQPGPQTLTAVVDNVVGGEITLQIGYNNLPLSACNSPYSSCTTDRGCHAAIPPCLENLRTGLWYAGVQAQKLFSEDKPITFTFSWHMVDSNPRTISNFTTPQVGRISNGEIKGFYAPFSLFSQTGSWLRLHLYIDSSKKIFKEGYDANLFVNRKPLAGPATECSDFVESCSASEFPGSSYLSCSIQLSPCELSSLYANGLYFAVEAVFTSSQKELWYQNVFEYTITFTHDIVPTGNDKQNPLFLDTGDVYSSVIPQNQYIFFRVPLHKGSVTLALSAPRYDKRPPAAPLDCRNYTALGVQKCITDSACGWCIDNCVPCSGKISGTTVCDATKILGCAAISGPPSVPVNPPTTAPDLCSTFSSTACLSPDLAGVCGYCLKNKSCGECSRTLITTTDRWCAGEIPTGCEVVRGTKRSVSEVSEALQTSTFGLQKLQMIISYSSAFLGPACSCWKPDFIFNVREGETIYHTIDSCRTSPTYVGVYGLLPPPNIDTPWQCVLNTTFPVRIISGDVQCMSTDGRRCLSEGTCQNNLQFTAAASINPLICGEQHRRIWGATGYETPTHWCALGLSYYTALNRQYSEIPYTLSVRESIYGTRGVVVRTLEPEVTIEGSIHEGETQNYELQFTRSDLLKKVMIVRLIGHWQSNLTLDLGFLDGKKLDNNLGSCYSVSGVQRTCKLSSRNGGVCSIIWGQCEWQNDKDSRKFAIGVRRDSANATAIIDPSDPASLYNLEYRFVSQEVRNLTLGNHISTSLMNGLYHHYAFTITNTGHQQELIVEAYFDAGHQLQANDKIEVFLNRPERPYLAGELSECFCSQQKWSDHQKVTFIIPPCDIVYGTYHLSIKTRITAYDAFEAQYTLRALLGSPRYPGFKLDFPTDYSAFLFQRADFHFSIPETMITGTTSTNSTLKISLAAQANDIAVVSLHKGNTSLCGCYKPIAKCSTREDRTTGQRPYCEFEVDWCKLAQSGAGDYFLTVYPEESVDLYNPVPYTIFAGVNNAAPTLATLTPGVGCGTQTKRSFSLMGWSTQHFKIVPARPLLETEMIEVYVNNIVNGNVQIFGNADGFATSQCKYAEPVRCAPNGDKDCILKLNCAKQIDYISIRVEGARANVPVDFSISACISPFLNLVLGSPSSSTQLLPGASQAYLVGHLNTLTESEVPTILIKVEPTRNDVPVTVTFSQGRCSSCTDFVKETACIGGPCWLAIHYWQLPANRMTANWYAQVDNHDETETVSVITTVLVVPATTGRQLSMTSGTTTIVSAAPGTWTSVEWIIDAREVSREVGRASGRVTSSITSAAAPAASRNHKVMFLVTGKPLTSDVTPTFLAVAGGASSSDPGFYDIANCCLAAGKWYAYIWNGNPTNTWDVAVLPTVEYVTVHTAASMESPLVLNVARGAAIHNAFIKFPGFPIDSTDLGTSLRISVRPTDRVSSSVTIYSNVNSPAGPGQQGDCTTYRTLTGAPVWHKSIYSCPSAPLPPAIYWIGVNSPTADRTYEVLARTVPPAVLNIRPAVEDAWSAEYQTAVDIIQQNKAEILDVHRSYAIRLNAQVEITKGVGTVSLYWNPNAAAGFPTADAPCVGSQGRAVATASAPGSVELPVCLEAIKTVYLGATVVDGAPTYRIRLTSTNLFPGDQSRTLTLETPTTLVNDASPSKQHLISFQLPSATPLPTNYLRFTLNNIKWTGTPGVVRVIWGQAASCGFTSDTSCNKAGDSCVTLAFPCQINALTLFSFHVTLSQPGSYTALIQLEGTEQQITDIAVGEERQVMFAQNALRFFRLDLHAGYKRLGPADSIVVQVTGLSCGSAVAWINRGTGASPTCNLDAVGGKTCNSADCTLFQVSSCDLMTQDLGGIYYITVRGLDQVDPSGLIKLRLKVSIIKGSLFDTKIVTFLDTEEHRLLAKAYDITKSNTVTEAITKNTKCTPEVLPQFADCCGVANAENVTRAWVTENVHYEYLITGGHHLGYGARIEVGVMRDVSSATVVFTTDYPFFCGAGRYTRPTTCVATNAKPCTFTVDSCAHSTRQVWVWVNPDSVKWVSSKGPSIPASGSSYEVAWIRPFVKEFALFEITPVESYTLAAQYHPFWLLPGEIEYIQIAHPSNYDDASNYHVYISAEKVFGGAVEIVQEQAWAPCVAGECTIRECHTVLDEDECTQKAGPCRCDNLNRVYIPSCYDSKANELVDDDKADHIVVRAIGTGSTPVTGRLKITFWEKEEPIVKDRCEIVVTGKSRFFFTNATLNNNQIYKFTVTDMEQDAGSVRLSLNEGKIALPRVACAEKAFCSATGASCSLYYRGDNKFAPRVSVYGEHFNNLPGNHHFWLTSEVITPDIVNLNPGITAISPAIRVDASNCAKPVAPQYYRYISGGTAEYITIVVVAPNARAWINRGHVTHGWGRWVCDGRKTGGVCETIISCDYNKTASQTYYIHVEGSSHEVTIYENSLRVIDAKFGHSIATPKLSLDNPYFAFRLTDVFISETTDPARDLAVSVSGRVHKTWLSYDKAGDPSCRIPQTPITSTTQGGAYVTTIPSCLLPADSRKNLFVNVAPRLPRNGEDSCPDGEFSVSSNFVLNNFRITAGNIFKGFAENTTYVIKPSLFGLRSQHSIDIGSLANADVIVTRVTKANMPITHTLWKGNYDAAPKSDGTCSSNCYSEAQAREISWLDNCWHCGGGAYSNVYVQLYNKDELRQNMRYNLKVEKRTWQRLPRNWTNYALAGDAPDVQLFTTSLNKSMASVFELKINTGSSVEIEVLPADCNRRDLTRPRSAQPLRYHCFKGDATHVCEIPLSRRFNYGSKSTKESRIWADDNVRIVIRGYQTNFQLRFRSGTQLCTIPQDADFCANTLSFQQADVRFFGGITNTSFDAQDRWAESLYKNLISSFDCPADQKCNCKPITTTCRSALKDFSCAYSFGSCSERRGYQRPIELRWCTDLVSACNKTFSDAGLAYLDCRHAFYTNQVVLTNDAPPPHTPPPPYIPPAIPPPPPVVPQPVPSNTTPATNDTHPEQIDISGLTRAAKLGITLAVLTVALILGVIFYVVIVHPRVGLRNTIESEGYAMM